VAFRDAVPAYQRLGTRGFTRYELAGAYDHVDYLESDALGPDTVRAFREALTSALTQHRQVDLFLAVNGGSWVAVVGELPAGLRHKLRLVYNTAAGGAAEADRWRALGAQAYLAHPGDVNLAPFFYVAFLRHWTDGERLDAAVEAGNAALHDHLDGWVAPLLLRASGFPAHREDLPWWEATTHTAAEGDVTLRVR
jgi:hypothetical protein